MSEASNFRFYRFGEFEIDVRRRVLLKNGEQIPIPTKYFDLLSVLVKNEGKILSHEELLDAVWEGTFVEQANLKKGVSALRQLLGETPNSSLFIRTVPRRGYSFVARVSKSEDQPENFFLSQSEIIIEEEFIETATEPEKLLPPKPANFLTSKRGVVSFSVGLIILGILIYFGYERFFHRPATTFSVEKVRLVRVTNEGIIGNFISISADGNYVLYIFNDGTGTSLRIKQLATGSITTLLKSEPANIWSYCFSPDGNYVYYTLNHNTDSEKTGLYRISILGGKPQKLLDYGTAGLTFSPDGNRLAFFRRNEDGLRDVVISINSDGTNPKRIFTVPDDKFLMLLNWSPDGQNLLCAFLERVDDKFFSYVSEVAVEGNEQNFKETVIIPKQENPISAAVWLPDKLSMILNIREQNADVAQIWQYFPATGETRRVTNDNSLYRFSTLTKDGKTLITTQETGISGVWIADTENFDFKAVTSQSLAPNSVCWTQDKRLTFVATENFQESIWMINEDGSDAQKLSDGKDGISLSQSASSDGRSITYSSSRSGTDQIWKIGLDGKGLTQIANAPKMVMGSSKLLSDGRTLLFIGSVFKKGWALHKQTADGQITQITEPDVLEWGISNDEKFLFYRAIDEKTKKRRILIKNFQSGETLKVFDFEADSIKWSFDGKGLIYSKNTGNTSEIIFQPLDSDTPKTLYGLRGDQIISFDFSRDGKKVAIVRGRYVSDGFLIKAEN